MMQKITQYGQYTTQFGLGQLLPRLNILVPVSVQIELTKHFIFFNILLFFVFLCDYVRSAVRIGS